ncbi:YesK family protein [Jeotgalibacillus marinus]|uniref:YesK family protein n=1 Tax=Jeotgalibacillus marinus TaxID=86667 RepID=UPI003F5C6EF9
MKKKSLNSSYNNLPGITGLVIGIALFLIGFLIVRGFEGAAYGLFTAPILIISIQAIILGNRSRSLSWI